MRADIISLGLWGWLEDADDDHHPQHTVHDSYQLEQHPGTQSLHRPATVQEHRSTGSCDNIETSFPCMWIPVISKMVVKPSSLSNGDTYTGKSGGGEGGWCGVGVGGGT